MSPRGLPPEVPAQDAPADDAADAAPRNWIFGYGSIINEPSRLATLAAHGSSPPDAAALVELSPAAGFTREWNFRAPSGFTAVGLASSDTPTAVCGVLFEAAGALHRFDEREAGYHRVPLSASHLRLLSGDDTPAASALHSSARGGRQHFFWTYIPQQAHPPSEEYPICQTYVDACLVGCLDRGGAELASSWVRLTGGWSSYWLNDAPMSRRPWLHRPRHVEIDAVLREQAAHTRFDERRHPEEFSGRWMAGLRGMWGVPARNAQFVGREAELGRLQGAMLGGNDEGGLTTVELVGMGGVGKTQLAIEFCYRFFGTSGEPLPAGAARRPGAAAELRYGLVCWLRSESAEVLGADLRALATDNGIGVQGLRNEEVVAEVRARLFRARWPWLLVFDNVTSATLIEEKGVLPRGCHGVGHVLITSQELREVSCVSLSQTPALDGPSRAVVQVGCLSTDEALSLLRRAGGDHLGVDDPYDAAGDDVAAGAALAERLGCLPLALALAAAYMRACEVSCSGYLRRLAGGARGAEAAAGAELLQGYVRGVAESFELSLSQLDGPCLDEGESATPVHVSARHVLDALSFCASDGIPKALVVASVRALTMCAAAPPPPRDAPPRWSARQLALLGGGVAAAAALGVACRPRRRRRALAVLAAAAAAAAAVAAVAMGHAAAPVDEAVVAHPLLQRTEEQPAAADACVEAMADRVWLKLKQFSLLRVYSEKNGERTATLHRLLAQSLRAHMHAAQAARVLGCCVWAVEQHWFFDAADISSWSAASEGIKHVQMVGKYTQALLHTAASPGGDPVDPWLLAALQLRVSALLTRGALCMSMALSRFEQARQALHTARAIQAQPLGTAHHEAKLRRGRAYTLETAGKVARYCGQLSEAEELLLEALQLWRECEDEDGAASTLHELGVVHLRRAEWGLAGDLLSQSLAMKRRRRGCCAAEDARGRASRFSDEAATLHQLAVVAMSSKPPRLNEAGDLLREALTIETQGPFALVGRAATLQQLARLAERRGDRQGALETLHDALELHRQAYGEGVPHVNKAAVLSQLASLSLQNGDVELAVGHLNEALAMRRQIYGHNGAHLEMALNLGKLGECDRARGDLEGAANHFAAQRAMLETLALSEACAPPPPPHVAAQLPLQRVIYVLSAGRDVVPMRLLNHLLGTLRWQRTIARDMGDTARAMELAAEGQQLQHTLVQPEVEAQTPSSGPEATAPVLLERVVAGRDAVRNALLRLRSAGDDESQRKGPFGDVLGAVEELSAYISRLSTARHHGLRDAALKFVGEVQEAAQHQASQEFIAHAFQACDTLRARLRDEGTVVTDQQTEGAYNERVKGLAAAGDYMLTVESLQRLRMAFGDLTVDAFASGATALLPRFWSADDAKGNAGIDAFAQNWAGERLLVHAPVSMLFDVIEKLERTPSASAVVVAPYWTGAPWFEPLRKLARQSLVLPAGSLQAVAQHTRHVKSWRAIAFHVPRRDPPQ